MVEQTLYIFAKAPVPGRVKTRLARSVGDGAACAIYLELLAHVTDVLTNAPAWRTVLAVTPDESALSDHAWRCAAPRIPQGDGDLGARMHKALSTARRGWPVVIVGSDIPDITSGHVTQAFLALAHNDLVFGPAVDGSYWLVGASVPPPLDLFADVRWSSPFALADTLANARGRTVEQLDIRLEDVDDVESYRRYRDRLGRQP